MAASNSCTTMQDTCATNNDSTHLPMAVQDTTSNSRLTDEEVSSKDNTEKLVPCPICHRVFLSTVIQVHANNCMDIMNRVESKAYDDLIFDVEPIPVQEDYEGPAGPNSNGDLSNSNENACMTNPSDVCHAIKEAVKEISLNVNKDSNRLYVQRKTMWKDFADAHKKWWIKWDKTLDITFLDEPAVDGGPKREFFGGALFQMKNALFEESADGYIPCPNTLAVLENKFAYAGQLCAFSVALGGPAPSFLAPWVYTFLTEGLTNVNFSTTMELSNKTLEVAKKQILDATTDNELQSVLLSDHVQNVLQEMGYRGVAQRETLDSRSRIIQSLYIKDVIEPRIGSLDQFAKDLEMFNVLGTLKLKSELLKPVFTPSSFFEVTLEEFLSSLHVQYSESGSNLKDKEVDVFKSFTDLLEMAVHDRNNAEFSLSDIVHFITGSSTYPPLGFSVKMTLEFKHGCAQKCKCRPTASTCALTMFMPVHIDSGDEMKVIINSALKDCKGFGKI